MAQNGLRPLFLGVSRAKKHPKKFPRPPSGRPAPMVESLQRGGGAPVTPAGPREERVRERRERIEIIFFYGELGNLEEPN